MPQRATHVCWFSLQQARGTGEFFTHSSHYCMEQGKTTTLGTSDQDLGMQSFPSPHQIAKRSCKQPQSSWIASQELGNHKVNERKYTRKQAFLSAILRGLFHWLLHRGEWPNIPNQVYNTKPHKFIMWPSQRQIWIFHSGHLTKPQPTEWRTEFWSHGTTLNSHLQQRALLYILPLNNTQDSYWNLPRKDPPDYPTQFQS